MSNNHPNRNRRYQVTPEMVVALRGDMTQDACANLYKVSLRTYQRWEQHDGGVRPSYLAWIGMREVMDAKSVK